MNRIIPYPLSKLVAEMERARLPRDDSKPRKRRWPPRWRRRKPKKALRLTPIRIYEPDAATGRTPPSREDQLRLYALRHRLEQLPVDPSVTDIEAIWMLMGRLKHLAPRADSYIHGCLTLVYSTHLSPALRKRRLNRHIAAAKLALDDAIEGRQARTTKREVAK